MVKKRLDIDSLFKASLSDYSLSSREGDWELMNHLLNEQQKKKKRRWFLFFLLFAGILLSGITLIFTDNNFTKLPAKTNHPVSPDPAQGNIVSKTQINIPKTLGGSRVDSAAPSDTKFLQTNGNNIPTIILTPQEKTPEIKSTNPLSTFLPKASKEEYEANEDIKPIGKNSSLLASENLSPTKKSSVSDLANPQTFPDSTTSMEAMKHSFDSLDTREHEVKERVTSTSNNSETINPNSIFSVSAIIDTLQKDSLYVSTLSSTTPDSSKEMEPIAATNKLFGVYLHGGVNMYTPNTSAKSQITLAPIGGLEVIYSLSTKLSIGLAGLFASQNGYQLNDTAQLESYFLDRNVSTQTIQIHTLQKIYIPLTLYVALTKKHSLLGSLRASWIINTKGNFSDIKIIENRSTEMYENNVNGYLDGIKPWIPGASVGYQFRVSENFNFSARFTRDFTNPYHEGFVTGVTNKPTWSLQTMVTLKIN